MERDHVLRLTYTAYDMRPFACDLGYDGEPFTWDDEERRRLRARLDALYFHLYGLSREYAGYVMDTFPIVRRQDESAFGSYRTRDIVLPLLLVCLYVFPTLESASFLIQSISKVTQDGRAGE